MVWDSTGLVNWSQPRLVRVSADDAGCTWPLLLDYLLPGETLPPIYAPNPVVTIPEFTLSEFAVVRENLPAPVKDAQPKTMKFYNQSCGNILYRTTVPAGPAATVEVKQIHDFAWLFLDGEKSA